ncbi:hypothetical protein KSS87_008955 [Heliosperma pusillum]|nr:hypothetical protein KSS87_008955 [Heliosperma pusillum]
MDDDSMKLQNPNNGEQAQKPKIVIIMGPTGSGKSKLAIDLSTHFPIEVINADSMQVYHGLDVLTNKVTSFEQKARLVDRQSSNKILLIEEIIARNHLPVIVGGTNFYIQALVSPFLLDDALGDTDDKHWSDIDHQQEDEHDEEQEISYSYDRLKAVDPVAANRIHPNDCRKIRQYLELFSKSGILPSQLFQEKITEKWGCLGDDSRYNCCFICVDASLSVLDQFVDKRVDRMMEAGLLDEVYDIYTMNADYTRGLRQAIGVREFEDFLCAFNPQNRKTKESSYVESASLKCNVREVLSLPSGSPTRELLEEAIFKLKLNTRRLVRRQKRRIKRLQTLFGWNIHFVDSTESLQGNSEDTWTVQVIGPAAKVINSFLTSDVISTLGSKDTNDAMIQKLTERDLWTRYTCEACGNRVLRGAHEWDQHKQGRGHRKRMANLKKRQGSFSTDPYRPQGSSDALP